MSEPNSDWQRYNIDQAIRYSIEAVKSVLLLNGAAAIALLAFMGANAGKEDPLVEVSIELFKLALMCFGGGASLCALTFLFAYIAQLFFAGIHSSECLASQSIQIAGHDLLCLCNRNVRRGRLCSRGGPFYPPAFVRRWFAHIGRFTLKRPQ